MELDTNDQQIMLIKQFLQKYGKLMLVLFIFFVAVVAGGRYWQKNRVMKASNASMIFQEMVISELQHDPETATAKGGQLMSEYKNTPYAQLAGLLLAKMAVASGDLDKAAEQLRWVIEQKNSQNLTKYLATVRLSAILKQQGKLDEALELVANDPETPYIGLYAQARGDVYVAKGDIEQAKKSYKLAIQSLSPGMQDPLLQMKLVDLGGEDNA